MRLLLISSSFQNVCLPVLNAARVSRGHSDESSSKLLLPGLCRGIKPKASHEMKATEDSTLLDTVYYIIQGAPTF